MLTIFFGALNFIFSFRLFLLPFLVADTWLHFTVSVGPSILKNSFSWCYRSLQAKYEFLLFCRSAPALPTRPRHMARLGLIFFSSRLPLSTHLYLSKLAFTNRNQILFIREKNHIGENSKFFDTSFDHFRVVSLWLVDDDEIRVRGSIFHWIFCRWRRRTRVPRLPRFAG